MGGARLAPGGRLEIRGNEQPRIIPVVQGRLTGAALDGGSLRLGDNALVPYASDAAFARAMCDRYPGKVDESTIRRWAREWRREA